MEELKIPTGRNNAIVREGNDRKFRDAINAANRSGQIIINNGYGYFRPDLSDPIDRHELDVYLASELHRAREILYKRLQMKKTRERMEATNEPL